MFRKSIFYVSLATALQALSSTSIAATNQTNITVSANVAATCTITATPLAFGAYDPIGVNSTADLTGTATVLVSCAKGASTLTIGMDTGAHVSGTQRQLVGKTATDLLSYNLFQPATTAAGAACPGTIPWTTTGKGLMELAAAPSKAARTYNVCGTIPMGQDASVGSYTDTVVATINF